MSLKKIVQLLIEKGMVLKGVIQGERFLSDANLLKFLWIEYERVDNAPMIASISSRQKYGALRLRCFSIFFLAF